MSVKPRSRATEARSFLPSNEESRPRHVGPLNLNLQISHCAGIDRSSFMRSLWSYDIERAISDPPDEYHRLPLGHCFATSIRRGVTPERAALPQPRRHGIVGERLG